MLDTPTANKEFYDYANKTQNWGFQTDQRIAKKPMWSPRFGFRWNTFNDNSLIIRGGIGVNSLIIRGGIGVFTGRVPYVWISNNISNTGIQQMSYSTFST